MEKLSISLEEEAWEQVSWFLRHHGYSVEHLDRLVLPDVEFDIYGVGDDLVVIGEATVRLGASKLEEFLRHVEKAREKYPGLFRARVVLVIYCLWTSREVVEKAREKGVWLIRSNREETELRIHSHGG